MRLLETHGGTTESLSGYIVHYWAGMNPNVKVGIKIATSIGGAVGVILITSLFVEKSDLRGGISPLGKPVRLIGHGIKVTVSEHMCSFIHDYVTERAFSQTFRIPGLYVNMKLLLETILLINKKLLQ